MTEEKPKRKSLLDEIFEDMEVQDTFSTRREPVQEQKGPQPALELENPLEKPSILPEEQGKQEKQASNRKSLESIQKRLKTLFELEKKAGKDNKDKIRQHALVLDKEVKELEAKSSELRLSIQLSEEDRAKLQAQRDELKPFVASLKQVAARKEREVASLEADIKSLAAQEKKLRAKIEVHSEKSFKQEGEKAKLEKKLHEVRELINQETQKISWLNTQAGELKKLVGQGWEVLSQQDEEKKKIEKSIEELEKAKSQGVTAEKAQDAQAQAEEAEAKMEKKPAQPEARQSKPEAPKPGKNPKASKEQPASPAIQEAEAQETSEPSAQDSEASRPDEGHAGEPPLSRGVTDSDTLDFLSKVKYAEQFPEEKASELEKGGFVKVEPASSLSKSLIKKLVLLLLVFAFLPSLAFGDSLSDCKAKCQADYDKWVKAADSSLASKDYYCGVSSTNCWSRVTAPAGQPDPCWSMCTDPECSPWSKCNDAYQSCCHESALINEQDSLGKCLANCNASEQAACSSQCAADQQQEPFPSCACVNVPPCPAQRDLSQVADRNNVGQVMEIEKNAAVLVLRSDTNTFCAVKAGSTFIVLPGERVRAVGGHAAVHSGYGYMIFMTPGSTFEMEDWAKTAASNQGSATGMFMKMLDGIYVFIVKPNTVGKFEVQFDSANLGVRGTEFLVQKNADQSMSVYLIEGKLEANAVSSPGFVKSLSAGQKISITPDGTPGEPQPFSPSEAETVWGGPLPSENQSAQCVQASDCPGTQFCIDGKCKEPASCLGLAIVLGTILAAGVLFFARDKFIRA